MNTSQMIALGLIGKPGNFANVDFSTIPDGVLPGWDFISGKWAVFGGAALATPTTGAEVVNDGDMELAGVTNWAAVGTPTTRAKSAAQKHAGAQSIQLASTALGAGIKQPFTPTLAQWYLASAWVYITSGGARITETIDGSAVNIISTTSTGSWINGIRTTRGNGAPQSIVSRSTVAVSDWYTDDISVKPLTLADMFATRLTYSTNVDAAAALNVTGRAQAGIVACLNSVTSPSSFIIATHDGVNAILTKCVNGTYTTLISAAAAYGAGKKLRLRKSGVIVQLFYDGVQVGADQTVSDAEIANNTRHGMFSTNSGSTISSFIAS